MATIWRNAGICRARRVSRNWSLAVLDRGRVRPAGVRVSRTAQPERARPGVHLRHERLLRAGVPAGQQGGDVVAGGDEHRLKRLTLGQRLPGRHLYHRLALPLVAGIGRYVGRGHGDHRAGPARPQRMVAQHHVPGHDLSQARDGHRLAAAVRAQQAGSGQPGGCLRPAGPVRAGRGPGQDPRRRDRDCQGHRGDRAQQLHRHPGHRGDQNDSARDQRPDRRSPVSRSAARQRMAGGPPASAPCRRFRPAAGISCGS